MKITYLSNTAIPSNVASSIQIVKMCEAFSLLDHDVNLITTNTSRIKSNIFEFYNVKKKFNIFKIENFKDFPLGFKYYYFSIISILKGIKLKSDIYITRNYFTCFVLSLIGKNTIMELHHDLIEESRIVQFIFKITNYLNSRNIVLIIAITKAIKDHYVNKYNIQENKILVLASGSSIEKKFTFNLNKNFFKIGYFGSVYKSRGSEMIIDLAKIDKKNKYFIYGNLKHNEKLIKKYNQKKNIIWRDYVPYKEIPKYLDNMDILIMPYVSSITVAGNVGNITNFTSPLKLFDYLCAGKIIICSNFNVLKEILKDKKNAIFIKNYKNAFSWKLEIDKIFNLREKQLIISKNNFRLSKKFSLKNRAKKILENIKF